MEPRSDVARDVAPAACHACGRQPSVVRLTAAGRVERLCVPCLRGRLVTVPTHIGFDLWGFCAALFGGGSDAARTSAGAIPTTACPACGLTLRELLRGGLLGCQDCYEAFASVLQPALEAAPGGTTTHDGER